MNESVLFVILQVVLDHPGVYLREIQTHVEYLTGTRIMLLQSVKHYMHDQGKSMRLIARQRDDSLRAIYAAEMTFYDT